MSHDASQIKESFVDVRKAFRLLHQYHRILLDITEVVGHVFNLEHYTRAYLHSDGAPNSGADVRGRWAWDFLPFYNVSLMYHPRHLMRDKYYSNHQPGDWMFELTFVADTAYDGHKQKGEPDPTQFQPPEQSESLIYLRLWHLGSKLNKVNWYRDIWEQNDWPEDGKNSSEIKVDEAIIGKVVQSRFNFEGIIDRSALNSKIQEFKAKVEKEIPEIRWSK